MLTYENVAVDANDVAGKWKSGRAIPHISQIRTKTSPKGVATVTPADDYRWSFAYDNNGNVKTVTDPTSAATSYAYSADKATFGSYVTSFDYDKVDQLTRTALPTAAGDPLGQLYAHQAYDANGDMVTTTMPGTAATIGAVAPDRKTQLGLYDTGWIASNTDKGKPTVRFDYTAEGWQTSRTPDKATGGPDVTKQHTWKYYVDGMIREESIASDGLNSAVNTYTYDANNNPLESNTASGITDADKQSPQQVISQYDSLDRLVKTSQKQKSEANFTVSSFSYDLNDNLAARTQGGEESPTGAVLKPGRAERFEYDDGDRLTRQLDDGQSSSVSDDRRISTSYLPNGWEKQQTVEQADAAGAFSIKRVTASDYLANGKLSASRTTNAAGTVLESHALGYLDGAGVYVNGNPVSDTFRRQGPDAAAPCRGADCTTSYTYDARDRLVKERTTGPATPTEASFALDAAGNIKTETRSGVGGQYSVDYVYDADRLKSQSFSGSQTGQFSFFYDTLGNLECKTTSAGVAADCRPPADTAPSAALVESYAYDSDSRLKRFRQFENATKTRDSTFTYDAYDRPVEQNEAPAGAPARTTISNYIGLSDDVGSEERRDGQSLTGELKETKSYSYDAFGRRLSMSDKLNTTTTTAAKEFEYAEDPHGNVSLLLDSAGKAQASYGYSAYGQTDEATTQERDVTDPTKILDQKSAQTNPLNQYRYSAKRMDPSSGSLDMGARRFGPGTAHFLQEDVYKDALGDLGLATDPLTQNRYSLAGANPVSFIEADGHEPVSSYTDRRAVNRPYGRKARPRRQQSTQTPDSYDRNTRPAYQQQVDRSYSKATAQRSVQQRNRRLRSYERGGVKEDKSLLNPIELATTIGTGGTAGIVRGAIRGAGRALASAGAKSATRVESRAASGAAQRADELQTALPEGARWSCDDGRRRGSRLVRWNKDGRRYERAEGLPATRRYAAARRGPRLRVRPCRGRHHLLHASQRHQAIFGFGWTSDLLAMRTHDRWRRRAAGESGEVMAWRLDTNAPDLAQRLQRESADKLRSLTQHVVTAALGRVEVDDYRLGVALGVLRDGRFGESDERASLKGLVDELDEEAWNLQDQVEAGAAEQADYLAAFERARAAMALWFSLDADAVTAAMEAVYEVGTATDERWLRREFGAAS